MTDKLHIADTDLALYAMGTLSAEEMDSARAHLDACEQCNEELRQNRVALAAYAQATPEAALPDEAKARFMARVATTPQTETQTQPHAESVAPTPSPKQGFSWRTIFGADAKPWAGALAGAMAILLIAVAIDDLRYREALHSSRILAQRSAADSVQLAQLMDLLTSSHVQRVTLHPTPVASPPPEGRVVYEARTGKLLLTASNLQPLPDGKTYELWILQPNGKKPLPAGTFWPDSSGNAAVILAQAPVGLTVQGFGVTIEKAGGSDTPTLPIVLSGL
ncbi:MAG: anti-sigma factor [Terracidiphilus sp.]